MSEETLTRALRAVSYGLYAIGARSGDQRNAFTANWLTQVSSDPALLAVAVENEGRSLPLIRAGGVFSVSIYHQGQRREAALLARPAARVPRKLEEMEYRDGDTGAPLLTSTLGALECRVVAEVPTGDHTVFIGEVVAAHAFRDGEPLTLKGAGFRYG